ncbi:ankyrin repeat domain-containing protein [Bacilliculturomica massiliensis]|uniref:ankyrin repeat domain-containing protein n=1 Tax=Bacilliculturomica massiliensis TaxID=1917867 RepID=UPI0010308370|nr:ankyrin repeat domain-containing protein [Bacilliculturomica massiliensis]
MGFKNPFDMGEGQVEFSTVLYAVQNGGPSLVRELYRFYCRDDVEIRSEFQEAILLDAAMDRPEHPELLETLLGEGISPAVSAGYGNACPLWRAVEENREDVFLRLLSRLKDLETPIVCSANRTLEIGGRNYMVEYNFSATIFGLCAFCGRKEMAERLIKLGARPDGPTFLQQAAQARRMWDGDGYDGKRVGFTAWAPKKRGADRMVTSDIFMGVPPWAMTILGGDAEAAEYFLQFGEDRKNDRIALLIGQVRDPQMIAMLWRRKPKLMRDVAPVFALRQVNADLLQSLLAEGAELPSEPFAKLGTEFFSESLLHQRLTGAPREFRLNGDLMRCLRILEKAGRRPAGAELEFLTEIMLKTADQRLMRYVAKRAGRRPVDITKYVWELKPDRKEFERRLKESGIRLIFRPAAESCRFGLGRRGLRKILRLAEIETPEKGKLDEVTKEILREQTEDGIRLLIKCGLLRKDNISLGISYAAENGLERIYGPMVETAAGVGGEKSYDFET